MSRAGARLGLIAGGGELPVALARTCEAAGRPVFVLRLKGLADGALAEFDGAEIGLAELGRAIEQLKAAQCRSVCFAGNVRRPDFKALKPDLRGLQALPGAIAAAGRGDDALLRFIVGEFEREGFAVEGAEAVDAGLRLPRGPLGRSIPTEADQADIDLALATARSIGQLDIGQGAVVAGGVVLAVEAQEGTDAMLRRCAELPGVVRERGVLAKAPKPIQDRRIDLPVIGVATVELVAAAGLAGIVGEAGAVLVVDRDATAAAADRLGLFIVGV